jgi:hypothetical protein
MSRLAAIAGDLTALVLTSQRIATTAEDVHGAVVRIMERHPGSIATPDREKAIAWLRVVVLPSIPDIQSESIRARLEQARDDITNIINITKTEMQENA